MTTLPTVAWGEYPARDLRLGDYVVYVRGTDIPVRWRLTSDPTTCACGHALSFSVALDGEHGDQRNLMFRPHDLLLAEKGTRR